MPLAPEAPANTHIPLREHRLPLPGRHAASHGAEPVPAVGAQAGAYVADLEDRHGPGLPAVGSPLLSAGCMDVAWREDGWLFVISRGCLYTYRTPLPTCDAEPAAILPGLGDTRQIEVVGDLAAVTSRDDGLWLVDVGDPVRPAILCHYDTIELATGVALGENVALVACRQYGLELVDTSDPARLAHLSTVRTGEAQSVFLDSGFAYVGVWAPREVVVCDVRNPRRPAVVNRIALDGYGDGLYVRDGVCFAATGHHARGLKAREAGDPYFGTGHGLEIYDVSEPSRHRLMSRSKLPRFYDLTSDMWDVQVSGDLAVVGDSHNGLYVFDVSNPEDPVAVGYHRLPRLKDRGIPGAVAGFTLGRDRVYVAGKHTGLHTVALPGVTAPSRPRAGRLCISTLPMTDTLPPPAVVACRPGGQVHEVALDEDTGDVWVAAGHAGLHRLRPGASAGSQREAPTTGVVLSVDTRKGLIVAGEGMGGLSIWRRTPTAIALLTRYRSPRGSIGQVRLSPDTRHVVAAVGGNRLEILDISSAARTEPTCVFRDSRGGLFYRTPFAQEFLPGDRLACLWNGTGTYVFSLDSREEARFTGWMAPQLKSLTNGATVHRGRLLAVYAGGYVLLEDGQETFKEEVVIRLPGLSLSGKPSVYGDTLYSACRWQGTVVAVDISDVLHPRLRWRLELDGNPGPVAEVDGSAVIPAGYQGVVVRPPDDPGSQ